MVPPSFTLSDSIPIDRRGPTDISDIGDRDATTDTFRGHGTGVASAAGGLEYGVAPRASLHLIKGKGSFFQDRGMGLRSHVAAGYTHQAIERAFGHIQGHYFGLRRNNGVTRAVINLSWGVTRQAGQREVNRDSELGRLFDKFLRWAVENDIVVVCAAGNFGRSAEQQVRKYHALSTEHHDLAAYNVYLVGDFLPQRLATQGNNALITVGAVTGRGALWDQTTPPGQSRQPYNEVSTIRHAR